MPEFQVTLPEEQPQGTEVTATPQPNNSGDGATAFSEIEFPADQTEKVEAIALPDKVCTACLEKNLIQAGIIDTFKTCSKCNEEFCLHGASKLDPQYCIHCCNDFKVIDVVESQQRSLLNAKGDVIGVRHFKVRHLTLSGMDWLFFNRAIVSMTDAELEHAIEYHLSMYHGMIYEREARRIKRTQRNRGKVAGNEAIDLTGNAANPFVSTQDGVSFVLDPDGAKDRTKKPKTVRTRSVKVTQSSVAANSNGGTGKTGKAAVNPIDLIAQLIKAGMTKEQLMALGKK